MQNNVTEPKITVIIPAHNVERFIEETIRSVLNQTFTAFKVIIIDDGSTDKTLEKIQTFQDPRIEVISGQRYGSPAKTRNVGLRLAKTPYIAFLDADDTYFPDALEKLYAAILEHPEAYVVQGVNKAMDAESRPINVDKDMLSKDKKNILPRYKYGWPALLNWTAVVCLQACLFRKEALDAASYFDEEIPLAEDYHLFVRLQLIYPDKKLVQIPFYIFTYRLYDQSICHNSKSYLAGIKSKKEIHALMVQSGALPDSFKPLIATSYNAVYRSCVKECLVLQQKWSLWDAARLAFSDKQTTKLNLMKQLLPYLVRSLLPTFVDKSLVRLKSYFRKHVPASA